MKPLIVAAAGLWTRESGEVVPIAGMNLHHLHASVRKVSSRLAKVQIARLYIVRAAVAKPILLNVNALEEIDTLLASLKSKRDELETEIAARGLAPKPAP